MRFHTHKVREIQIEIVKLPQKKRKQDLQFLNMHLKSNDKNEKNPSVNKEIKEKPLKIKISKLKQDIKINVEPKLDKYLTTQLNPNFVTCGSWVPHV